METTIPVSHFEIGDTVWSVASKELKYEKGRIDVNSFFVGSDFQNININGVASEDPNDSLVVMILYPAGNTNLHGELSCSVLVNVDGNMHNF